MWMPIADLCVDLLQTASTSPPVMQEDKPPPEEEHKEVLSTLPRPRLQVGEEAKGAERGEEEGEEEDREAEDRSDDNNDDESIWPITDDMPEHENLPCPTPLVSTSFLSSRLLALFHPFSPSRRPFPYPLCNTPSPSFHFFCNIYLLVQVTLFLTSAMKTREGMSDS